MKAFVRLGALGVMAAAMFAAPAVAGDSAASKAKKGDPNEVVCEKQEVLGSRLAVKRICKTRAEWAEQRRADREMVDKTQMGATGKPQ